MIFEEIQIENNTILNEIPIDKVEAFMFADGGAMGRPGELKFFCKCANRLLLYRGNRFADGIDNEVVNHIFTQLNETREWVHFPMGFGNHLCMKPCYENEFTEMRENSEQHIYKAHETILKQIIIPKVEKLNCEWKITIRQVQNAVEYLVGNEYSSSKISKYLKDNFNFEVNKKQNFYLFDADIIWEEYFIKNVKFKNILDNRKITSMQDLIYYSEEWRLKYQQKHYIEPSYDPIDEWIDKIDM